MLLVLPFDNKSGSVMSCLKDLMNTKATELSLIEQEKFDQMLG